MANVEFGQDISCLVDLDPMLGLTSGIHTLAQGLANRLQTPRGSLWYDPDYGTDVRAYLNGAMTTQKLGQLQAAVQGECMKDRRVLSAACAATFSASTSTLSLKVTGTTAAGPFALVLSVSAVSVSLLSASPS